MTSVNLQAAHGVWLATPGTLASASPLPATGAGKGELGGTLTAIAMMIGALILLTGAIMLLRRKVFAPDVSSDQTGLVMDELRAMRQRGALSEAEYDAARAKLRDRLRGAADPNPASSGASPTSSPDTVPAATNPTATLTRPTPRPTQRPIRPDKPPSPP